MVYFSWCFEGRLRFITIFVSGWGRLRGGGSAPDILQQAMIPIVSHEECKKKYDRYDKQAHLCAGQGHASGSGGCQGDSGGPLVCEKDGTWYLHGAVSFGKRGCPTKYNTVFARITTYLPWIMDKLGNRLFSVLLLKLWKIAEVHCLK